MLIDDNHIDNVVRNIGEKDQPYFYDYMKGRRIDREALQTIHPVNNFLTLYQKLSGRTIGNLERLKQLLEAGTNLWNEESFSDTIIRVSTNRKEAEQGLSRNKILDFFGIPLHELETKQLELFLQTLRPLYVELGPARHVGSSQFPGSGEFGKIYNLKPLYFGDKFDIQGNELVTTEAYAEQRDTACKRYATTDEQKQRVKTSLSFLLPFKDIEKTITNSETVRMKSYVNDYGLPFPLCLVQVSADRKIIMPNVEYVEGVQLYPKPTKVVYQSNYSPFARR